MFDIEGDFSDLSVVHRMLDISENYVYSSPYDGDWTKTDGKWLAAFARGAAREDIALVKRLRSQSVWAYQTIRHSRTYKNMTLHGNQDVTLHGDPLSHGAFRIHVRNVMPKKGVKIKIGIRPAKINGGMSPFDDVSDLSIEMVESVCNRVFGVSKK